MMQDKGLDIFPRESTSDLTHRKLQSEKWSKQDVLWTLTETNNLTRLITVLTS